MMDRNYKQQREILDMRHILSRVGKFETNKQYFCVYAISKDEGAALSVEKERTG